MIQMIIIFAFILIVSGDTCETSASGRIFGGHLANIESFPYIVSLQNKFDTSHPHFCGGVIISPRFILTAAHCVHDKSEEQLFIKAGTTDLGKSGILRQIDEIIIHPGWNDVITMNFDFALLKLAKPLNLTNNSRVKMVKLPRYSTEIPIKSGCAAGWGLNNDPSGNRNCLRAIELEIIEKCRKVTYRRVTEAMFCAGHSERDTCQGDSGGPFVNNGVLYGVVSFGEGALCTKAGRGVYAKVPYVMKWILENIREF